jgi:hypothetical protein
MQSEGCNQWGSGLVCNRLLMRLVDSIGRYGYLSYLSSLVDRMHVELGLYMLLQRGGRTAQHLDGLV